MANQEINFCIRVTRLPNPVKELWLLKCWGQAQELLSNELLGVALQIGLSFDIIWVEIQLSFGSLFDYWL